MYKWCKIDLSTLYLQMSTVTITINDVQKRGTNLIETAISI